MSLVITSLCFSSLGLLGIAYVVIEWTRKPSGKHHRNTQRVEPHTVTLMSGSQYIERTTSFYDWEKEGWL
jgi:hypothetical protein